MNSDNLEPIGPSPERWTWVDEFIRGINSLTPRNRLPTPLTEQEWAKLEFLRYRVEKGLVS